MKKLLFTSFIILMSTMLHAQLSRIEGKWFTIDEDGNKKSLVKITKNSSGVYEGVILKLYTGNPDRKCDKCPGSQKNMPIVGLKIITDMKVDGKKISGGSILDPATGKIYSCTISFDQDKGKLKVRGSLDKSGIIGRTQYWEFAGSVD